MSYHFHALLPVKIITITFFSFAIQLNSTSLEVVHEDLREMDEDLHGVIHAILHDESLKEVIN